MNYVCMRTWEENIGGEKTERGRKQDRQVMREQQSRLKNMSRTGMRLKKKKKKRIEAEMKGRGKAGRRERRQ